MKLQKALECIKNGGKIRHKSWYGNIYIEMFEGIIREDLFDYYFIFVEYIDFLGYEKQIVSMNFLLELDDNSEDCWEMYIDEYID